MFVIDHVTIPLSLTISSSLLRITVYVSLLKASFRCTKILKKLHLFLAKVAEKSCFFFKRKLRKKYDLGL